MLRTQLDELKANIKNEYEVKISKLQEEMDAALVALSKVEETLFNTRANATDKPQAKEIEIPPKAAPSKSIPTRMKTALGKIHGEFARSELFQMTSNDGGNAVAEGSLAAVFAELVKTKEIVAVKESRGKTPGIYRKAKEINTQPESSPAV